MYLFLIILDAEMSKVEGPAPSHGLLAELCIVEGKGQKNACERAREMKQLKLIRVPLL
jgi:hypothetical protein